MSDCSRADIRDRLPDLIHDRLGADERAEVMIHVTGCAVCSAELELLVKTRALLVSRTPDVDVARIVSALPKPKQQAPAVLPLRPRRRWMDWKIAATITVIAVGGGTYAVTRHGTTPTIGPDSVSIPSRTVVEAPTKPTPAVDTPKPMRVADSQRATSPTKTVARTDTEGLEMTGRLGELSDDQLEALLSDIEKMQAVPVTDPEPVILPVTATRPGRGGQ